MPSDHSAIYQQRLPVYEQLRSEALFAIDHALLSVDYKIHSVTARVKTLESLTQKVQRKGLTDPFAELSDIVGIRIVCLFLADISDVVRLLRSTFDVVWEDNKIADNVSAFGYLSYHLIVNMKGSHAGPRYDAIANIPFEVQVRTIAMDAWANVSHHLAYKQEVDIPAELQRDFHALSGLFYVADKHFEMFYRASTTSRHKALEAFANASQDAFSEPLNADILSAFLRTTFPDRSRGRPDAISDLLTELISGGVNTAQDLDRIIRGTENAVAAYESDRLALSERLADTGVARVSARIWDPIFHAAALRKVAPPLTEEQIARDYELDYAPYRALLK